MSNKAFVQSLYEAFARGDAETVLGSLASDCEWREAESQPYAEGNPYTGPKQVGEGVFAQLMSDFEGFTVTPHTFVTDGEKVVALGRYTGTRQGSGDPLDAQFAHVWTVGDGEIKSFQQYTDTAQMTRLLSS